MYDLEEFGLDFDELVEALHKVGVPYEQILRTLLDKLAILIAQAILEAHMK